MNDTPTLNYWPLVLIIEDVYVPQWAEEAVRQAGKADQELIGAVVAAIAFRASCDAARRVN